MYTPGDRVKHTQEFVESVTGSVGDDVNKLTWLHGVGTIVEKLSKYRLLVKWDCDTEDSIVAISNVWFTGICGDSFFYDDRPDSLLVGFCKRVKDHTGDCTPTELR